MVCLLFLLLSLLGDVLSLWLFLDFVTVWFLALIKPYGLFPISFNDVDILTVFSSLFLMISDIINP